MSLQGLCFTLRLKFWQGRNLIWARHSRNTGQSPPVSKGCEIPQREGVPWDSWVKCSKEIQPRTRNEFPWQIHLHQVLPNHIRGLSLSTDLSYGRTYLRAWETRGATLKDKMQQVLRVPRMFCCLLEKFSCSQGHNLSQLVLRVPDHSQDSNEPRVCGTVLFKGEGRKLSVPICYKQHSAELQVSWPRAQDLLLLTKTHRWGSRVKNSPPQ